MRRIQCATVRMCCPVRDVAAECDRMCEWEMFLNEKKRKEKKKKEIIIFTGDILPLLPRLSFNANAESNQMNCNRIDMCVVRARVCVCICVTIESCTYALYVRIRNRTRHCQSMESFESVSVDQSNGLFGRTNS